MEEIIPKLMKMDSKQLEQILEAFKQRHAQLYPDWEIHIISLRTKGTVTKCICRE